MAGGLALRVDVSDEESVSRMVEGTERELGAIDLSPRGRSGPLVPVENWTTPIRGEADPTPWIGASFARPVAFGMEVAFLPGANGGVRANA